ncbi:hypothetical protein BpHYR1_054681 [Brachionus plicatilis]|uniref:Uncharacterized protein n=1 Tax=Brachionus plicatilis TaxID=10195 RepID=A0A3M7SJH6_BRAPC|nr:hypothetical protein BpHYR1_054681 [Brachionus plicatilis]
MFVVKPNALLAFVKIAEKVEVQLASEFLNKYGETQRLKKILFLMIRRLTSYVQYAFFSNNFYFRKVENKKNNCLIEFQIKLNI